MSAWDNLSIRDKAEMMRVAIGNGITNINDIKREYNEFAEGGPKKSWTMEDEANYRQWRNSLPDNLKYTDDNIYDMVGAYQAGMQPTLKDDGLYHLGSRDPQTGKILKAPYHSTYLQALNTDARIGYYPTITKEGTYTSTWEGNNSILPEEKIEVPYRAYGNGGSIHIKPSHRGRLTELKERTGKTEAELYNDGNPAHRKMVVFARNARKWHDLGGNLSYDDGIIYDGGTLPELQVTGYAPIRLTTYYPVVSKYPYTGHSELEVPIDTATWNTYKEDSVFGERTSPYLTINKGGSSKDYNLLTNNCADATLSYLNSAFNTKENPVLFTTPGDVRDYAINTLGGKVVKGKEKGSDIVLIPRNADNYRQLSEDAVLWHNIHDPHSSAFSLKGPLRYNKRHSLGGTLYPDGGILDNITRGMQVDTDQCATWSNGLLRNNGYLINGDAWRLNNVDTLFNGFTGLEKPAVYDRKAVEAYNHMASDNVYKNFDSKTLDKTQPYVVNMYYNNSPALEDAYNNGKGVTGTHTGILTYDNDKQKWVVTHNIHGKIHQENFVPLQNGKGKYGVTAIYQPREDNLVNRVKGFFGFANGGRLYDGGGKKRPLHPNVGRAMQYFIDRGFTDYQAAGLVGNLMRESSMNPDAVNKSSGAYGLLQWLGPRKENLFKMYGEHPTFDQQLDYLWHELNTTHKRGLKAILAAPDAPTAADAGFSRVAFLAGREKAIEAMNRSGQDGEGALRKGIDFANDIMGIKTDPVRYNPQDSLPPNFQVPENWELLYKPHYPLDELQATGTFMPAEEVPLESIMPTGQSKRTRALDILSQYEYLSSLLSQ